MHLLENGKYLFSNKENCKKRNKKIVYDNRQKIFCVWRHKIGTTSLAKAMQDFGYKLGAQREGELLFNDWVKRDFRRIINYCKM